MFLQTKIEEVGLVRQHIGEVNHPQPAVGSCRRIGSVCAYYQAEEAFKLLDSARKSVVLGDKLTQASELPNAGPGPAVQQLLPHCPLVLQTPCSAGEAMPLRGSVVAWVKPTVGAVDVCDVDRLVHGRCEDHRPADGHHRVKASEQFSVNRYTSTLHSEEGV